MQPTTTTALALPQLKSGNDWLEYMIANGWTLTEAFESDEIDSLVLHKSQPDRPDVRTDRIEYICSYKNGSSFVHDRWSESARKWVTKHTLRGEVEADFGRFLFLAHSLGWVDIRDAAAMFERVTGTDILSELKAQLL